MMFLRHLREQILPPRRTLATFLLFRRAAPVYLPSVADRILWSDVFIAKPSGPTPSCWMCNEQRTRGDETS
ncbi:hypothetical protein DAEQUDRAFT_725479 [Daedalea quercina L-15889]|uniref:Uncharacterized protein n=1 Tax=Daedalea quercina L-15889 TaxID=1314783 RepID=A0A165RBB4_9APHY|nr:hypothetical protein DAEQUDRAFT_725479 [Daedalea quercina L-15889]